MSGASLSQFNGLRYLKYKAYLDNTDNLSTPTINDVSVCFSNAPTTSVGVASVAATRTARGVAVTWRTGTEARIAGFNVFRGTVRANRALIRGEARRPGAGRVVPVRRPGRAAPARRGTGSRWSASTAAAPGPSAPRRGRNPAPRGPRQPPGPSGPAVH